MITLTLSRHESILLEQALATKLAVLMNELVHTDHREFRDHLRAVIADLERLQRRVAELAGTPLSVTTTPL